MFQKAYAIASKFTRPIVLSRKTIAGNCSSSIGTYVVINDEGWIVTAYHVAETIAKMIADEKKVRDRELQEAQIRSDPALDKRTRQKKLAALGHPARDDTDRASAWWGMDNVTVPEFQTFPAMDLAVGKLEPFDKNWVPAYPKFKDPTKNFQPGTSLCKLGFPFHQIVPTWESANNRFVFST